MIGARWDLGLSKGGLQRRVAKGEVSRLTRGVYRDGPPDAANESLLFELEALAVRYPDGRLAGQAAAALYGLDGFDVGAPPTMYRDRKASARELRFVGSTNSTRPRTSVASWSAASASFCSVWAPRRSLARAAPPRR